ncbi:sugar transferase [Prevotella bivia DNF00188]|uniref:sugar transferase n=1 Tax=Prevotella bivia TaxID=28125 RepID=UPI00050DA96D|nr:sugar transferase [Prevotella bivia]KGF20742.1 sugar transferase [Prevotella bivia DNF00188]
MYKYVLKRVIDFAIALIALICISPLLLVVTVWLHFANKGAGAFFLQERPGLHGKVFKIIKFKTMNEEKGSDGKLLPDIQRITPVGSFIRKTSLDELPQLINVLKGDMALIGPRPLLVKYLSLYSAEQMRRHDVRPGISGWAQCHGRNSLTWSEKFKLDIWYVDHVSLKTDLEVIFTTIKNVLMMKDINNNVNNGSGKFTQEEFNGSN